MTSVDVSRACPQCNGTGIYNRVGEIIDPCPCCNGNKYITDYIFDEADFTRAYNNLINKCNEILEKCNLILEKLG